MCKDCGCDEKSLKKIVDIKKKVLESNDIMAGHNMEMLERHRTVGINLMSSPGSGKTTLLEKTIEILNGDLRIAVIEGDLETEKDAERIRKKGVPVFQITTGQACHLDAAMLHNAIHELLLNDIDILFVENVGNLVCPASYALGTHINVVLLSTTEGDDKPAKYPPVFRNSDLMLITKTDQLVHTDFNIELAERETRVINPEIDILKISARTGEGMDRWIQFLKGSIKKYAH